jgi:hypothetical protein
MEFDMIGYDPSIVNALRRFESNYDFFFLASVVESAGLAVLSKQSSLNK